MKYVVYILYSEELDRFYVGHTGDAMEERLRKHLSNHSGFTATAKDWILKYSEEYLSKKEAYARELAIKRKKSKKFIQNLINSAE
ncbi:GIY-YIG nuclease family protein [Aequorivita lipolytica]|uniref:GIY-YIG nuclease family protein n=1 Tax=Aequorivita lipolytica TaxID=153267 RepID=UPI0039E87AB7